MNSTYTYLNRDLLVRSKHLSYQPNDKHFSDLIESLQKHGQENAIAVCAIPDSNKFEIVDGDLRFLGWCIKLNRTEILCEIKKVEYTPLALIGKRIELNRHRQKTLADKLQAGLEYYYAIPEEGGERNDLKGGKKGSRMDRASQKSGASTSYLYAYKKIVEYDAKHPEAGLLQMFRKCQIGLLEASEKAGKNYQDLESAKKVNGVGAELLDNESLIIQTDKKIDEHEEFPTTYQPYKIDDIPNFATTRNRVITANSYESDRIKLINKSSAELTVDDIPEGWLQKGTRIAVITSDPFLGMKGYANETENLEAIGNEATPEQHLKNRIAVYQAMYGILRTGDSCIVEYDGGNREDSDNLLIEDFNIAMVRELGFHKKDVIAWHRKSTAMRGSEKTNLYSSWTPMTWFVKDNAAFMKSKNLINIPFHQEGKERKFGIYGGRENPDGSYTKNKVDFKKPYKRYTNFIDQNDFIDSIKSAGAGSHSNYILKTYGVKHPASWLPVVPMFPILYLTRPDDIIIDPFAGTGSSIVTACLFGRRVIGCDISKTYYKILIQEMEKATREFNPESAINIERMFQHKFAA